MRVTHHGHRLARMDAGLTPDPDTRIQLQVCSAGAVNRDYATLIDAVAPLGIPLKIAADTARRSITTK